MLWYGSCTLRDALTTTSFNSVTETKFVKRRGIYLVCISRPFLANRHIQLGENKLAAATQGTAKWRRNSVKSRISADVHAAQCHSSGKYYIRSNELKPERRRRRRCPDAIRIWCEQRKNEKNINEASQPSRQQHLAHTNCSCGILKFIPLVNIHVTFCVSYTLHCIARAYTRYGCVDVFVLHTHNNMYFWLILFTSFALFLRLRSLFHLNFCEQAASFHAIFTLESYVGITNHLVVGSGFHTCWSLYIKKEERNLLENIPRTESMQSTYNCVSPATGRRKSVGNLLSFNLIGLTNDIRIYWSEHHFVRGLMHSKNCMKL